MSRITPIKDHICKYIVESSSNRKDKYIVNLLANFGNGECDCKDFQIRKSQNVKQSTNWILHHIDKKTTYEEFEEIIKSMPETCYPMQSRLTMCKHIYMARLKLTNDMLKIMSIEHQEDLQNK